MRTLGRDRCAVCFRTLTDAERELLDSDRDFYDHHGHTMARTYDVPEVPFLPGDRVVIRGGFEDGLIGTVIANEPLTVTQLRQALPQLNGDLFTDRPFRYRVLVDLLIDGSVREVTPGETIGGLHPFHLELLPDQTPGTTSAVEVAP